MLCTSRLKCLSASLGLSETSWAYIGGRQGGTGWGYIARIPGQWRLAGPIGNRPAVYRYRGGYREFATLHELNTRLNHPATHRTPHPTLQNYTRHTL